MATYTERYLIGGDVRLIEPLLSILDADAETTVHSVTRNKKGDPERFVVSMDRARAAALQAALGPPIIIEPDELLNP